MRQPLEDYYRDEVVWMRKIMQHNQSLFYDLALAACVYIEHLAGDDEEAKEDAEIFLDNITVIAERYVNLERERLRL